MKWLHRPWLGGIHSDMSPGIELGWRPGQDDRHFESINVWRSAERGSEIEMMPLCVCAMDSVAPADVVFGDGVNTGDVRQARSSSAIDHRSDSGTPCIITLL